MTHCAVKDLRQGMAECGLSSVRRFALYEEGPGMKSGTIRPQITFISIKLTTFKLVIDFDMSKIEESTGVVMTDLVYRFSDVNGLYDEVRRDLDSVYAFGPSTSSIFVFDLEALRRFEKPNELIAIMEAAGATQKEMIRQISNYILGISAGTCFYTRRRIKDADYVIALPDTDDGVNWCQKMGEETMHGEHRTEHSKGHTISYIDRFSDVAAEFFGGLGHTHVAKRLAERNGWELAFNPNRPSYERETNLLHIELGHIAGYQLAHQLPDDAPRKEMFHEPKERRVWGMYNDMLTPVIDVIVPCEGKWDLGRIEGEVKSTLEGKGLRSEVRASVESDHDAGGGPICRPPS